MIHIGERTSVRARGKMRRLASRVRKYGFMSGRMKTGTPPRVDGRSLNYSFMLEQKGDTNPSKFSYSEETVPLKKQKVVI